MNQRVLGLDLGANSIGWALLDYEDDEPTRLVQTGVRIFDAGVEGDIESGKEESRGKKRRDARQVRKQLDRRARRHVKLVHLLQHAGLFPEGDLSSGQQRHAFLVDLDKELRDQYIPKDAPPDSALPHVFSYALRARALDEPLAPHALGRALYHLAQRRGFLSNRKATGDAEEKSVVKKDISALGEAIRDAGARTLGEYFASLDPRERRIRQRWTGRQMYQDEFDAIWNAQAAFRPDLLTPDLRLKIQSAIFYQRPLKLQKHLVGKCELEPGRPRAPIALLEAQRFRLLQKVNDLRIIDTDFHERGLTDNERATLLALLETQAELKFPQARKLLKLPRQGCRFNFEAGGEDRLIGDRTAARLRNLLGTRWDGFTPEQRRQVVEDLLSFENDAALERRGLNHYGLDPEAARAFAELELEPGYCSLSRKALNKILPLMEQGIPYATAHERVYADSETSGRELIPELLPPLIEAPLPGLRNPAVSRVLTELAKVVNAIIRKHGKPNIIRIELARDLKRNREDRKRVWKKNRDNQRDRERAAKKILDGMGNANPRRDDILRVLLAEECDWKCPYTGHAISMANLLGETSQFDIEHIIPFSRSLDDSYMNKTLCYHEENRHVKRNQTPFETYGQDKERFQEICQRVKDFKGDAADSKLRRFRMESIESLDDFSKRQLNDTRYASTLAARYLAVLYGRDYKRHIQVSAGQVTAQLRNAWNLNAILGDGGQKSRDDHRHHAVDAVAIALTDRKMVQSISRAAQQAESHADLRWWKTVPLPWDSFFLDVQAAIDATIVSHRVSRKVNGPLHEETNYSPPRIGDDGKSYVHVRKAVASLSPGEIEAIVDPRVRLAVRDKLAMLGSDIKAFAKRENHPQIQTRHGYTIPVHRVRIRKVCSPFPVGQNERQRFVTSASNHHMEIVEVKDKRGKKKWDGIVITQYEAVRRLRENRPIVNRDHGSEKRFLFSIAPGESIEVDDENAPKRLLYVVRSIWNQGVVEFVGLADARKMADIRKSKEVRWKTPAVLASINCQKVTITPLGEVRRAND